MKGIRVGVAWLRNGVNWLDLTVVAMAAMFVCCRFFKFLDVWIEFDFRLPRLHGMESCACMVSHLIACGLIC